MKKYTDEVKAFIAENIEGMTTKDMVELVNSKFGTDFTESKMKSYKKNHGLKSGTLQGVPAGQPTKLYPDEVRKFIQESYIGVGHQAMADLLNQTFGTSYTKEQMKAYYARFKLNSGLTGHFQKGFTPFNKGIKKYWIGGEKTQFKKGDMPHNWVPLGSERVTKDGYIQIKIREGRAQKNWRGKHILIWEEINGPLPPSHAIIFGDGDKSNFDPDNLLLVSRKQLLGLNKHNLIQSDAELTKTGIVIANVYSKISERKRKA
ncbi:MAG: HNH endonuclease signature motif containing protein [Desulfitobacterium sp.]